MKRLIEWPGIRALLLETVAAVPPGQRLHIPALRDALLNQADILNGLQALVDSGELDRNTLRPMSPSQVAFEEMVPMSAPEAPAAEAPAAIATSPTGAELFKLLVDEGRRRGMTIQAVSLELFGNKARIYSFRDTPAPRAKSIARVRRWLGLADEVAPSVEPRPLQVGGEGAEAVRLPPSAPAIEARPTGAELAAEIDAMLERIPGSSTTRAGMLINGCKRGLEVLRQVKHPKDATIAKVRALVADPPIEDLRSRAPLGDRRFAEHRPPPPRRDPTERPIDPGEEAGERQRVRGARQGAAARRSIEKHASALVDAGVPLAKAGNQAIRGAMNEIHRRREAEVRAADPFEAAKLKLQRVRVVHSAAVTGGRADRFIVSGCQREVTKAEIIALAAGELTANQINEGVRQ